MAVPKFFDFFVPTLRVLNEKSPMKTKELRAKIADDMNLSEKDKAEMLPSGRQQTYANRILWSIQYLKTPDCCLLFPAVNMLLLPKAKECF